MTPAERHWVLEAGVLVILRLSLRLVEGLIGVIALCGLEGKRNIRTPFWAW